MPPTRRLPDPPAGPEPARNQRRDQGRDQGREQGRDQGRDQVRAGGRADRRASGRGPGRPRSGQRSAHSLESILAAAVALLDEAGEPALTFRALAARLGGGVGSVYWYVSSKEELLDRATNAVMGDLLEQTDALVASPNAPGSSASPAAPGNADAADEAIATLRQLSIALFGAMEAHPWLSAYLMRDISTQPNSLRIYERFGQQILRLSLTREQSFHAVSAIINYVVGIGAEMGQAPDRVSEEMVTEADRRSYLAQTAQLWLATDPAEFPFLHEVAQEFAQHEDIDQFTSGLDLMLAGLRQQRDLSAGS